MHKEAELGDVTPAHKDCVEAEKKSNLGRRLVFSQQVRKAGKASLQSAELNILKSL